MKLAEIRFNDKTGKFEGVVGNIVKFKSKNKRHVEGQLKANGFEIAGGSTEVAVAKAIPKVEFTIDERFEFIEKFVTLVGRGVSNSLIVAGPGGLGKTYSVINTLNEMGKKELGIGDLEGDYVIIKGHSTAKALYRTLHDNNSMTIIFDDCDSVFRDPIAANILKAALDSYDKRVISWNAEGKENDDLPNRFEFVGKVIFISNLSMDKIPQAVVSRSLKCDVTMTLAEKVERIESVVMSEKFMPNYDQKVKMDVVEFIKKNAESANDLNIRTATIIAKLRYEVGEILGGEWERMALYSMVS